jgi:hypothetical protein
VKKFFDSDDWMERRYLKPDGGSVRLFVGRSYDPKRLYHHPELALAYGTDVRLAGIERFGAAPDVPVRVLTGYGKHEATLVLYSLLQDGAWVDNPYLFQLRTSWKLLFRGRSPMTLFFVEDAFRESSMPTERTAAARVLVESIRTYVDARGIPAQ